MSWVDHRLPWRLSKWLHRRFRCPRDHHEFRTWGPGDYWTCTFCPARKPCPLAPAEVARRYWRWDVMPKTMGRLK